MAELVIGGEFGTPDQKMGNIQKHQVQLKIREDGTKMKPIWCAKCKNLKEMVNHPDSTKVHASFKLLIPLDSIKFNQKIKKKTKLVPRLEEKMNESIDKRAIKI